jgi:hypothetical protein
MSHRQTRQDQNQTQNKSKWGRSTLKPQIIFHII